MRKRIQIFLVFSLITYLAGAQTNPVITFGGGGASASTSISENSVSVATITATDADLPPQILTYSITGGADQGLFFINPVSGELSFIAAPNFETPLDAGGNNIYDVQVTVSDDEAIPLTDVQDISVAIFNVLETAPTITSGATASVAENSTSVMTVTSSDPDAGDGATYSLSGGADALKFTINPASGALSFSAAPNFELPTDANTDNVYEVAVRVTDKDLLFADQAVSVTITNVSETVPTITSAATASVAENSTSVMTVTSSDPDAGDGATYSLSGGADALKFTINPATGVLSFSAAPNFELPNDANTDNVYEVTVRVTDKDLLFTDQAVSITVTNVSETAPTITSGATASVAENTTSVMTVTSTDADAGDGATFSLSGGADALKFTINPATGALSFNAAPNFELPTDASTNNVYEVTVRVTDKDLLFADQAVSVTVTNVSETAPTITSAATASVAENATSVMTVTSSDPDAGDGATYSLSGGADASKFTINPASGALSFNAAPNFELPTDANTNNVYEVTVRVTDKDLLFADQAVSVTVTNVSETAPTITSAATASVAENTTSVMTVTSSDPDAGDGATYSLSGGADASKFTINPATGVLSFSAAPNFELPTDANTNNVYEVTVHVTDKDLLFADQAVSVTVTNVSETAPSITSGATASVAENITSVMTVTSTDADAGDGATYSLSGGADASKFTINPATGVLSFSAAPNFELPADANTNNVYEVTVRVTDKDLLFADQAVSVTVTNVSETAPTITSAATASVAENATSVMTVTSSDPDAGDGATYSLSGGADASKFTINPATGALSFNAAPNFELPTDANTNNVYEVTVRVTDKDLLFADQAVSVTVTNVSETAPTITSGATASVAENATSVMTVTFSDPDAGDGATYSLSGGADASKFTINPATGALSFSAAPNFEFPTDANTNNVYEVTVRVTDKDLLFADQAVSVTVTNASETAPTITSGATASVAENATSVMTVTFSDPDAGDGATYSLSGGADALKFTINPASGALSFNAAPNFELPTDANTNNVYEVTVRVTDKDLLFADQAISVTVTNVNEIPSDISLSASSINENVLALSSVGTLTTTDPDASNTFTYTLVAGAGDTDNTSFTIAGSSLQINNSPNYEAKNSYTIRVRTTDQGALFYEKSFVVTINDLNETPSDIALSALSINENVPAASVAGTFSSTDPDASNTFTYTLVAGAGDTDNASFTITGSSLQINNSPNYEAKNSYSIRVRTTDQGALYHEESFVITVNDLNEVPTNIAISSSSISENVPANSTFGTLSSSDPDASNSFAYTLVTGLGDTDNAFFNISGNILYIVTSPDFETKNSYSLRIRTTDQGSLIYEKPFVLTINNANEAPTNIAITTSNIAENAGANATVGTLSATDVDLGSSFVFSLPNVDENSFFSINGNNLEAKSSFNYEAKNSYLITVRVTDNGSPSLSFDKQFTVHVIDVNEAPVLTSPTNVGIPENSTVVMTVTSTDVDAGDTRSYSILGGADANKFQINSSSGQLSFLAPRDYEAPGDANSDNIYEVIVKVADLAGLSANATVLVSITNVNEAPVASNLIISGPATVCKEITAGFTYSDPEEDARGEAVYQWYRADVPTGAKTAISGATSVSYTLTLSDQDKYLFFEVTPKAVEGVLTGVKVMSPASAKITNLLPTVSLASTLNTFCQGKSADLTFTFNGSAPFNLTYTDGTQNYTITSATSTYTTSISKGGNYSGVTLEDNLNCPVTNLPSTVNIVVKPLPDVVITGLNNAYNVSNPPVVMQGTPSGGVFSGNGVVPSTNTFYPNIAGIQNSPHSIVYAYTSPTTGCFNADTVKVTIKNANAFIDGLRTQYKYCNFDKPFIITGANNVGVIGSFTLLGGVSALVDHQNNTATITPSQLSAGSYTVRYSYLDGGVTLYIDQSFTMESLEKAIMLNLPDAVYCTNSVPLKLAGNYNIGTIKKGVFAGAGIENVAGDYYLKASSVVPGRIKVLYTYATDYGCSTKDSVQVTIGAAPNAAFEVANLCWNGDSTSFVNKSTPLNIITGYLWKFGDNQATEIDNKSSLQNPKHKYITPKSKVVELLAISSLGCRDTVIKTIYLGGIPAIDFSWHNECLSSEKSIEFKSVVSSLDNIASYNWSIRGGAVNADYSTSNISHTFSSIGDYRVKLLVATNANCKDSLLKQIRVRPTFSLKDTLYKVDFENGKQYWYEDESATSKWILGLPGGSIIKSAYSGANSYYTSIVGNSNQQMVVSGPCFDFSGTTKPFIEMWVASDSPKDKEGAVVQYLLEDSVKWATLGTVGSGLNWYSSLSIASAPGSQPIGWSGPIAGWVSTRHSLQPVVGKSNVRFRVVYGTNATVSGRDGFAFDNIFIGQRNKFALMEHFANNSSPASNASNTKVNELLAQASPDLISLQYHTSFPGADSLNTVNQSDPGVRVLYYGIGSVPVGLVNGGTESKYIYDFSNKNPDAKTLSLLMLNDAEYDFKISGEVKNSQISGAVTIEALKDLPLRQTTFYIAVAEDITVQTNDGAVTYFNVVKKLLPSAAGTPVHRSFTKGQSATIAYSGAIPKVYDVKKTKVVAFIQDEASREIYHVESTNNELITSAPQITQDLKKGISMKFYPNPASEVAYISFGESMTSESVIQILDNFGRVVRVIKVLPGVELLEVDVNTLAAGVYFVRMLHKGNQGKVIKVIISR